MKQAVRTCVAYIAGRLISRREAATIYDASQSKHIAISGFVSKSLIDIHDYLRDCKMSGSGSREGFRLYDHGEAQHLSLTIEGDTFEGYDYGSVCHFRGKVDGSDISFYDYGETRSYSYRL